MKTDYTYEGATFEIEYDIDWSDSKAATWASIWSITHNGVEFIDILSRDLVKFFEEELNNRMSEYFYSKGR